MIMMSILQQLKLEPKKLAQHVLIVGTTGSGKTQTSLSIIHDLYQNHSIPFLVLESAKREYRGLIYAEAFKDKPIRIYTVGNETVSPFMMNPFQLLDGVRVDDHIRRLVNCFLAALPSDIGSLPAILETAMHNIYRKKGWEHNDICASDTPLEFPTMREFVEEVKSFVDSEFGETSRIRDDLRSVLSIRLSRLLLGSREYLFDADICRPSLSTIFTEPTILELDSLEAADKSLVSLFLLVFLREYVQSRTASNSQLNHITIVEEAHNLLSGGVGARSESVANIREEAVNAFCNMLAEIRAYGEGLIIIDQRPSKLASDAIANTNTKIIHRLIEQNDRTTIYWSILARSEIQEKIGTLNSGEVIFFTTGLHTAEIKKLPFYSENVGKGYASFVSDEEVHRYMRDRDLLTLPYPREGCLFCKSICKYRLQVRKLLNDKICGEKLRKVDLTKPGWIKPLYCKLCECNFNEPYSNHRKVEADFLWCAYVHLLVEHKLNAKEEVLYSNRSQVERACQSG